MAMLASIVCSAQLTGLTIIDGKVDMPSVIENYANDIEALNKVYIFKDSPEYYNRFSKFYGEALHQLKTITFNKLAVGEQAEYLLLKRNILKAQHDLNEATTLYKQVNYTVPFAEKIVALQANRRRGGKVDPATVATLMSSITKEVQVLRKQLDKSPPLNAKQANKAGEVVDDLRRGLQNTFSFYNAYDPLFTWWVKKPYDEADSALMQYATFIKKTVKEAPADCTGITGTPIGAAALKSLLEYEMIPYSAEELVNIANREFAWCDAEMTKVSQQMGFGNDWKKALEKVKENYVEPGKQPQLVNTLAEEAIAFIEMNNMVTVPPLAKEVWRMSMLTEAQQRLAPFFLGGESILIGYPTDKMDQETKMMSMRSNNYGFSHATVFHELIPGHNLQFFMWSRYKPYRSAFRTPFSVEGWPLYWEMLLWDKNFNDTPEKKVGALFWRMHRCARIIFSLNYQLGKWTPKQCIDFLVERVGHERFSAEGEVRRSVMGNYGPLYQIAYMMGGLQLRALYKEMVTSGKMTEKEFHDRYLHENAIPIEMFRAIITNQKLPEEFKTQWRFAD